MRKAIYYTAVLITLTSCKADPFSGNFFMTGSAAEEKLLATQFLGALLYVFLTWFLPILASLKLLETEDNKLNAGLLYWYCSVSSLLSILFLYIEVEAVAGLLGLVFLISAIWWQKVYLRLSVWRSIGVVVLAGLFGMMMHALIVVLFF